VCVDVGPRGWEVEMVRVSARQGPMRPPRWEPCAGDRWRWEDVAERLTDDEREGRRCQFDDPGTGPSHVP
jgi:hypothetical protein